MKFTRLLFPLLAVALLAGCGKASPTAVTATSSPNNDVPTHAQPKLPTMKIYLGVEVLDAELALSPKEEQTGLMFRTNVNDETAMFFSLGEPMIAPNGFWMTNCPISLSAAYINLDGVIEEIHHLEKNDNVPVTATNDNIVFVLEVNDGWFKRHNIHTGTVITSEKGPLAKVLLRQQ